MSLFPWLVAVSPADEQSKTHLKSKSNKKCYLFLEGVNLGRTEIVAKPQIVYNRGMCTTVKRAMFCTRNGEKHIENLDKVCELIGRLKGLTESEYLDLCAISKLENARALEMAKHYPSH